MQNPLARSAIAWCSPPVMLALCSDVAAPHLAARLDARADDVGGRVVHVLEARVVVGAEPALEVDGARGACRPARRPRSARRSCTVAIRSSSAIGAATGCRWSPITPSSSARRMVRSTRIGDIGWLGPKLYSVSVESKTTVAGPAALDHAARLPAGPLVAAGCPAAARRVRPRQVAAYGPGEHRVLLGAVERRLLQPEHRGPRGASTRCPRPGSTAVPGRRPAVATRERARGRPRTRRARPPWPPAARLAHVVEPAAGGATSGSAAGRRRSPYTAWPRAASSATTCSARSRTQRRPRPGG